MKAPGKVREVTGDVTLERIQRQRDELVDAMRACPFFRGKLVSVDLVAATATTIRHGLGVRATCIVVRPNYDGSGSIVNVTEGATAAQQGLDSANELSVVADHTGRVDLWFYPVASKTIDPRTGLGV